MFKLEKLTNRLFKIFYGIPELPKKDFGLEARGYKLVEVKQGYFFYLPPPPTHIKKNLSNFN